MRSVVPVGDAETQVLTPVDSQGEFYRLGIIPENAEDSAPRSPEDWTRDGVPVKRRRRRAGDAAGIALVVCSCTCPFDRGR